MPTDILIIVEHPKDWTGEGRVITAAEYLDGAPAHGATVINLCRGYKYLSIGYYCSLLAEARGQAVLPSVKTINDLSRKAIYSLDTSELNETLNTALTDHDERTMPIEFSMDIFLGATSYKRLARLARQIFDVFPAPVLRVDFEFDGEWQIRSLKAQQIGALNERQESQLMEALASFDGQPPPAPPRRPRYHIAMLHNPDEELPPSNPAALDAFIQAGRDLGVNVELVEKKDYSHIAEYDALFIRETTAINHHTYLFSKKAQSEEMIVVDDPVSILRCTNKVYLADLLRLHEVPTPYTVVLREDEIEDISGIEAKLGYPMVMKIPDGAFSRGVSKVANRKEFYALAQELFKQSSLILVQEYLYTEFDWRIGVLDRKPIFASQYFMSKGHWQVAKRDAKGKAEFGKGCAVPLDQVPAELLAHAVKAANLIGDGLYGVDMKMTAKGPVVIEVNDNPNIDVGIEDGVLGESLYRMVLQVFIERLDRQAEARRIMAA
jgi:glutathione synthase/RimK-type ligase-like ATP-grasp enzyme